MYSGICICSNEYERALTAFASLFNAKSKIDGPVWREYDEARNGTFEASANLLSPSNNANEFGRIIPPRLELPAWYGIKMMTDSGKFAYSEENDVIVIGTASYEELM